MLASGELKKLDNNVTSFTSGQKYLISDKSELERLATLVNSGKSGSGAIFILGEDIDLKNEEWTPIGTSSKQFKGSFDGNGHTIKNLKIDNSTANYQGLFGYTGIGSEIKNIGLVNCNVTGSSSVGGLVGYSSSSITNSYATGVVSGDIAVGGLVGTSNSTITNSYATGDVTGSSSSVGGLVGYAYSTITNSYATGDVTGSSDYVGGLVGWAHTNSTITNSYATGVVTGISDYVGGLVGWAHTNSTITNSYATGVVTGDIAVGGLVGNAYTDSTITNSYATGDVTGTSSVGGLVGYGESSTITNSYATGVVSGDSSVGGLLGQAYCAYDNVEITDSVSYSTVKGNTAIGSFVGEVTGTYQYIWNYGDGDEGVDEGSNGELLLTNCSAIANNDFIGGYYKEVDNDICYEDPDTGDLIENYDVSLELDPGFDLSIYNASITAVELNQVATSLQVGIYGDNSNQLNFDTNFSFDLSAINAGIGTERAFNAITEFINILSEKSTQFGAIQNRLESALESIEVNITNLASSRSTIQDADMAELSSTYIQQQILQEASSALMASSQNLRYENVLGLLQGLR